MRIQAGDKGTLLGPPVGISEVGFQRELERIRPEYAVVEYDASDGADCYLNKPGSYDVSNRKGQTMRFTWSPAYPKTASMSTLRAQKGHVAAGTPDRWWIDQQISLSYGLLFSHDSTTPKA
jgi:hypothetical protein